MQGLGSGDHRLAADGPLSSMWRVPSLATLVALLHRVTPAGVSGWTSGDRVGRMRSFVASANVEEADFLMSDVSEILLGRLQAARGE
jgi:hypothetical protein